MKDESNFIGYDNYRRLERGDRLHFKAGDDHREDCEGPREFDVTVSGILTGSRFGPRILTVERIPNGRTAEHFPDESSRWGNDFYLDDEWIITLAAPTTEGEPQ
jgi:hypothetical protein